MKKNTQSGFSLLELLLVVTIIGVVAAIGVPNFQKGLRAADNGAAFAQMRVISTAQVSYFSQNGRFARLNEINAIQSGGLGSQSGSSLTKSRFVYEMSPLIPTDAELKDGYTIIATTVDPAPFILRVTQTGEIVQITP